MTDQPLTLDLTKYIEVRLFGERPHIRKRRIPVATLAYSFERNGWDVERLAYEYTLSQAEVLAALLYYQENKAHIDAQEEANQVELDRLYRQHNDPDEVLL